METGYTPTLGYESFTVSSAVKQGTPAKYIVYANTPEQRRSAKSALITVEGADIRFTTDGTAPVAATVGHKVLSGGSFTVNGFQNVAGLKMIRNAAVDATVHITYYGG